MVLICISLKVNDTFMCFLNKCISSLEKYLQILCPFLVILFAFLLLRHKSFLMYFGFFFIGI